MSPKVFLNRVPGPRLFLGIVARPGDDEPWECLAAWAQPIVAPECPVPVDSGQERRAFETLHRLAAFLEDDMALRQALGARVRVQLEKPLTPYETALGSCLPDFVVTVTLPAAMADGEAGRPDNDGTARYIVEVMGSDDPGYERKKARMHARMQRIGRFFRMEATEFDSPFNVLLASGEAPGLGAHALRLAVSAREALPPEILRRWQVAVGVDILDGLGSTEMLHIFITNRAGDIAPGASGRPVEGYEVRLVDDDDRVIEEPGALGALEVKGPTSTVFYWNRRVRSTETFRGAWTRTGDKYTRDENGVYAFAGRAADMLEVGGIYVSPFEVEGALLQHEAVLEAAVVGAEDPYGLTKPKAFVVLREGGEASAAELRDFVRGRLAAYKYPRWVEFVDELPKTATGKIQ